MCGRFQISKKVDDIQVRFHVDVEAEWNRQIYNAAPTMTLPVITSREPGLLNFYKWGLIPFWAKDADIGQKLINAKAETLAEKPSFKNALKSRRCLIPSDGFYEWRKEGNKKQPFRICMKDEGLYAYAGLWESWKDPSGQTVNTFVIITTRANELVAAIHDRMPVILLPEFEKHWLDIQLPSAEALQFLNPFPSEEMKAYKVSEKVNSVRNDTAELILPLTP
ncbi:MAG: SOS response-associated peptidase [Bacteroidetes bacterium]|nr:SOS response-associated peptidase [Bacteroidota bacterium]